MVAHTPRFLALEQEIARERGPFWLFALHACDDAPGKWELLVSAPWIEADRQVEMHALMARVQAAFLGGAPAPLWRVVALDHDSPTLAAYTLLISAEHSTVEIRDSMINGYRIGHAFVFAAQRPPSAEIVTLHMN